MQDNDIDGSGGAASGSMTAPQTVADVQALNTDDARLALFKAIGAIKIGTPTDDKLIIAELAKQGVYLARRLPRPCTCTQWADDQQIDHEMGCEAEPEIEITPASEPEWIEWAGGKCPVDPTAYVDRRLRGTPDLKRWPWPANLLFWNHTGESEDIIKYRVVPKPADEDF